MSSQIRFRLPVPANLTNLQLVWLNREITNFKQRVQQRLIGGRRSRSAKRKGSGR